MDIRILNDELVRLAKALEVLADALQRERMRNAVAISERDQLRGALTHSNRQMALLLETIKNLRAEEDRHGTNVVLVDFGSSRVH